MLTKSCKKNAVFFSCIECDYNTSRKSSYDKHLLTAKHQNMAVVNKNDIKVAKSCNSDWECTLCYRQYKSRVGLWKHKKLCSQIIDDPSNTYNTNNMNNHNTSNTYASNNSNKEITPELIFELIKQNKDLQQTLIDQNKTIIELAQKTGTTNSYNNNNNKTFNLQVFLNETCKDAINLSDFINQLQISISDLEETGTIGYAEGISRVFINNLKDIDYTLRPIHCSDSKRETLYIKDYNQWAKDDEQKSNLTKAIKQVANKNIKQISEWQKLHPEYSDPDSKQNDKYMKIVLNSMSGSTKEESDKNYEKIARNIVKEVVIEKN
jgi:hypothetical protein